MILSFDAVFNFGVVQFIYFSFMACVFGVIKEETAEPNVMKYPHQQFAFFRMSCFANVMGEKYILGFV